MLDDDGHLEGDTLKTAIAAAEAHQATSSRSVAQRYDRDFDTDADLPTGVLSFWGHGRAAQPPRDRHTGAFYPNIFIWGNELELTMRILTRACATSTCPTITRST